MKPSYERNIEEFLRSSMQENTADETYFEQQRNLVAAAMEPSTFDDDPVIRYKRRFLEV